MHLAWVSECATMTVEVHGPPDLQRAKGGMTPTERAGAIIKSFLESLINFKLDIPSVKATSPDTSAFALSLKITHSRVVDDVVP